MLLAPNISSGQELTIRELRDQVAACNTEVKAFDSAVESAKLDRQLTSAQRLPTLSLNANGYLDEDSNQSNITVSVPLVTFGLQKAKETNAERRVKESEAKKQKKLDEITRNISKNLVELQTARQKETALNYYLGKLVDLEAKVVNRTKAGLSAEMEVLGVSNEILSKQNDISQLVSKIFELKSELRRDNCGVANQLISLPSVDEITSTKTFQLSNNSEIKLLQNALQTARASIDVAALESRPTLEARAVRPFEGKGKVGLSLTYEYQNLGRTTKVNKSKEKEKLAKIESEIITKETELSEMITNLTEKIDLIDEKIIPDLTQHAEVLDRSLQSKLRLLEGGRVKVGEVVNAYQQLANVEVSLLEQQKLIRLFIVEIQATVGW